MKIPDEYTHTQFGSPQSPPVRPPANPLPHRVFVVELCVLESGGHTGMGVEDRA